MASGRSSGEALGRPGALCGTLRSAIPCGLCCGYRGWVTVATRPSLLSLWHCFAGLARADPVASCCSSAPSASACPCTAFGQREEVLAFQSMHRMCDPSGRTEWGWRYRGVERGVFVSVLVPRGLFLSENARGTRGGPWGAWPKAFSWGLEPVSNGFLRPEH